MATYERRGLLIHLTLVQQLHGQTIQNGYYFSNKDLFDDADLPAALTALIETFRVTVLPDIQFIQSQECVARSLIATTLIPANGPISETILETSQGVQVEPSLPSYCASILTLRSGFGGKSNSGRSYYAGLGQGFSTAGRLDAGVLTGLQNIGDKLLAFFGDAAGTSPFGYVIFSRKIGTNEGGSLNGLGISWVTQTIARIVLGTERHRKIGIGN